jgi:cytochrome P450/NADPH-cytochrome P450 reductase
MKYLHGALDEMIERHRSGAGEESADLLDAMLTRDSSGEPVLGRANIYGNMLTLLTAGQLTTSELMPNALYNLMRYPAVLARAQAEVDAVFGVDDDYQPTYEGIGNLAYMRQVLNETLRLCPPVPDFDRMARTDTTFRRQVSDQAGCGRHRAHGRAASSTRMGRQCRTLRSGPV